MNKETNQPTASLEPLIDDEREFLAKVLKLPIEYRALFLHELKKIAAQHGLPIPARFQENSAS